jgi:hypothetical protein
MRLAVINEYSDKHDYTSDPVSVWKPTVLAFLRTVYADVADHKVSEYDK